MDNKIENIKNSRHFLLDQLRGLTAEQMNQIPKGFNNNIIWNLAHLISGQQGIFYARAELPVTIEERYFKNYRPNTRPEQYIDAEEIDLIKGLFIDTIDQLRVDYNSGLFGTYPSWKAMPYGIEIGNVQAAVDFLIYHDGLHTGYIMAQKRVVLG